MALKRSSVRSRSAPLLIINRILLLIFFKHIRFYIYCFILFYSFTICNNILGKQYINKLVERNDFFFLPFKNQKVFGELFEYFIFKDQVRKNKFVGLITIKGEVGTWTRRWDNGIKKSSGVYIKSKKEGLWKDWNKKGVQVYQTFYENGKVVHLLNCLTEKCL